MKPIYALSIKQPWAWLVCKGFKDIENRDWYKHMPPLLSWPGYAKNVPMRIYVHAGISKSEFNECTLEWIKNNFFQSNMVRPG